MMHIQFDEVPFRAEVSSVGVTYDNETTLAQGYAILDVEFQYDPWLDPATLISQRAEIYMQGKLKGWLEVTEATATSAAGKFRAVPPEEDT